MMNSSLYRNQAAGLLITVGILTCALPARGQECERLKGAPPEQLRALLVDRSPDDRSEPFCTELALWTLGASHDAMSIPLLFKYLTFKREPDDLEKAGVIHRIGTPYPAVNALQGFGPGSGEPPKAIISAILEYLSQPLTDLQRANAVDILTYHFREQPEAGVRTLIEASKKRRGSAGVAVRSAAKLLAQRCSRKSRESCIAELAR